MPHTSLPASPAPRQNENLLRQHFVALCDEAILFCEAKNPRQAANRLIKAIESIGHKPNPAEIHTTSTVPNATTLCALYREAARLARKLFEYRNARKLLLHAHDHCGGSKADTNDSALMRLELAEISVIVGEHVSAERFFLECIRIGTRLDTLGIQTKIKGMQGLALLYAKEHRFGSADSLARENLEFVRKVFGQEHEEMAYSLALYGSVAKAAHRLDEALVALQQAVALLETFPNRDPEALGELQDLLEEVRDEYKTRKIVQREAFSPDLGTQTREVQVHEPEEDELA